MNDDVLRRLADASSDDEREWVVIQELLEALPDNLRRVTYAATIPHWFNGSLLAALSPDLSDQTDSLLNELIKLPFVEAFPDRGYNIHEKTRKLVLNYLWKEKRDEYISFSKNAVSFFTESIEQATELANAQLEKMENEEADENQKAELLNKWLQENRESLLGLDRQYLVEKIYHTLIADPEQGADAIWEQGAEWHNEFDYTYASLSALVYTVREHVENGRVQGRGQGWGLYWEGVVASNHYEFDLAKTIFKDLISNEYKDNQLLARAHWRLGDVHKQLSEYNEARARYEEALPIYRSVGQRLGEANCIQALGDVALGEKNYDQAIQLTESAIEISKQISQAHVAGGINQLANIYEEKKDYPGAIETYTRAMELFTGSQAYIIRNRANVYLKMEDAENARRDIESAERIQPDHPYLFLRKGELAILQEQFDTAIGYFERAINLLPRFSGAFFGIGLAHLRAGRANQAINAYQQGLTFTDAYSELEDSIEDLEKLKSRQPALEGVEQALSMLRNWKPKNK